jgi:DNA-binding NarL/FixJ family response regulator
VPSGHEDCFRPKPGSKSRCRILIADDDPEIREQVRQLLATREGFEACGEACNGEEAIERAKQLQPDLIILDAEMPGVDGLEAARIIRKFFPEIRILIFSVHKSEEMRQQAIHAGAAGYLLKSDGRQLLKAIETVLRDGYYAGSTAAFA